MECTLTQGDAHASTGRSFLTRHSPASRSLEGSDMRLLHRGLLPTRPQAPEGHENAAEGRADCSFIRLGLPLSISPKHSSDGCSPLPLSNLSFSAELDGQEWVEEESFSFSASVSFQVSETCEHLEARPERGPYFFHFCTIAPDRPPVIFQTCGVPFATPCFGFHLSCGLGGCPCLVASILGGHTLRLTSS